MARINLSSRVHRRLDLAHPLDVAHPYDEVAALIWVAADRSELKGELNCEMLERDESILLLRDLLIDEVFPKLYILWG